MNLEKFVKVVKKLAVPVIIGLVGAGLYFGRDVLHTNSSKKVISKEVAKKFFEERGFKSGKVSMPELGIEATLSQNQFYKIENVPDVYKRQNELLKEYGTTSDRSTLDECVAEHVKGKCMIITHISDGKKPSTGQLILVKSNLDKLPEICVYSHEYGHMLWNIQQQELIYNQYPFVKELKRFIKDSEDFALVCGSIGARKAGYDLGRIHFIDYFNPEKEREIRRLIMDITIPFSKYFPLPDFLKIENPKTL